MNLINADCMEYMRSCKDKQFDLAVVDPPYYEGVADFRYFGQEVSTTGVKRIEYDLNADIWDSNVPSFEYYNELCRISKHQIIFGINYFDFAGLAKGGLIVWDKKRAAGVGFSDGEVASCSLIDSVRFFRYTWDGMRQERMNWQKEEKIHPTQKPIALYEWILMNYAETGQTILDTHMGSGSSAIAAAYLGLEYTGVEIDSEMFKKACERIKKLTEQERLFA